MRAGRYCVVAAGIAASSCVFAAEGEMQRTGDSKNLSAMWTIAIGVETRFEPTYAGSRHHLLWPYPLVDVRHAGTPEHFLSPRDGLGFPIIDAGKFEFGPVAQFKWPRKESRYRELRGLGDTKFAPEVGGFANYWWTPWLRTRAELRHGISGHRGLVSDLTSDIVVPLDEKLTLSGGPRLTLANADASTNYFGVTPARAASSGLPIYRAGGGVYSAGMGTQLRQRWSPALATHAFIEYEKLMDSVARSPLITQRGSSRQLTLGVGVTHSFDVQEFW
jgi:outer membrane protein